MTKQKSVTYFTNDGNKVEYGTHYTGRGYAVLLHEAGHVRIFQYMSKTDAWNHVTEFINSHGGLKEQGPVTMH